MPAESSDTPPVSDPVPPRRPPPGRGRRWLRRALITAAVVLALGVASWLGVPPLLKWQGEKIGSEQLGRPVHIGRVDFKPWSLELTVDDVSIGGLPGAPDLLSVKRIYANAALQSIWKLAPVLDALQVDEPALRLTHLGEGHYDIDDILARFAARPQPAQPSEPPRFALYNIALKDGRIDFDDRTVERVQQVRGLQLAVPFISNLPAARQVTVQPRLAFALNGSAFDSQAEALPFDASQRTSATVRLSRLDLTPYLGYLPAGLPLRLQAATVDADLKLAFEQTPRTSLRVDGTLDVSALKAVDAHGGDALAFDALKIQVDEARPLERQVHLGSVQLEGPRVDLRRDRDGRLNLLPPETTAAASAPARARPPGADTAKAPASASSVAAAAQGAAAEPALALSIDQVAVRGGAVNWRDESTAGESAPAADLRVSRLDLNAKSIAWPLQKPFAFDGSLALAAADAPRQAPATQAAQATPPAPANPRSARAKGPVKPAAPAQAAPAKPPAPAAPAGPATLAFEGHASDRQAELTLRAAQVPLALAQPYLAAYLVPQLTGRVQAEASLSWAAPQGQGLAPNWSVKARQVVLEQLLLRGEPMAASKADEARELPAEASSGGPRESRPARAARAPRQATAAPRSRRADDPRAPDELARIERVELTDAQVDGTSHAVTVARMQVQGPRVDVERDAQQHWMAERWLRTPQGAAEPGAQAGGKPTGTADAPWSVRLEELAITGAAVGWRDEGMRRVARAELSDLQIEARKLTLEGKQPMEISLKTLVGTGRRSGGEPGRLAWRGQATLEPLSAQGTLEATRLPVQAFEPYFGDLLNVDLLRADAGFKGRMAFTQTAQGPRVRVQGDARIEELRTFSRPGTAVDGEAPVPAAGASAPANAARAEVKSQAALAPTAARSASGLGSELLSWKQLRLDALDAQIEPGKAPQVAIGGTQLSDFYARLVIDPSGRFNLQDIVKSDAKATGPAAAASAPVSVAASAPASGATPPAAAAPDPLAPVIRFGPTKLVNGRIDFADHFIRPNYSADLTDLNGSLGAFSSVAQAGAPQMADLVLTGRAEGSAALDVRGKLNPLATPLALDIQAKVSDLDLPPLSPYSVKYAGHGIERGKLSMDVGYKILPDGQLTATNKLVLNQLEFGDAVPGAPASLPVQLATALLADSDGVIDLDLPISGSLNDPQFSLGPIIFKAIINLIGKAITAPFTLLARAFGGDAGQDLSQVAFAPGSAVLNGKARTQLDKVAKALADRPGLKLTVAGSARLDNEREGAQRQRLYALVAAEQRSASSGAGAAVQAAAPDGPASASAAASAPAAAASEAAAAASIANSPDYPALLKRLYRRADIPGKPRNAIGMLRDIGVPEMEALLMAHIDVGESAMRQLAVQRGVTVKDYLAGKGIAANRLFLGAVQTDAPATDASAAPASPASAAPAAWVPHAELSLGTK